MIEWICSNCGASNSVNAAYLKAGGGLDCGDCGHIEEQAQEVHITFDRDEQL